MLVVNPLAWGIISFTFLSRSSGRLMRGGTAPALTAIGPRVAAALKNLKNNYPLRTLRSLRLQNV